MKLLMFWDEAGPRPGVLRDQSPDEVIDLAILAQAARTPLPADLLELIDAGDEAVQRVRTLLASGVSLSTRMLPELRVLAPLDPPRGNVIAIGRNYSRHAQESARAFGDENTRPTVFTKAQTSLTGPFDDIPIDPRISDKIDWEVELGVVIGRAGINIPKDEALQHVFGYTVVNDVTARDMQEGWGGQYFKGKSLDASSPIGPVIVTADEIPDPQALRLALRVNGVVKQDGSTQDMIYPVSELISWLSVGMTLRPGTLIATGTPDGVGFARNPPEFLRPGDVMETEVERIGLLRNRLVEKPAGVAAELAPRSHRGES